ncbi:LOW QUALITY PROTEIN: ubiquitin carboxyl-terminal hydrolase 36-like [Amazona ochrocephala]
MEPWRTKNRQRVEAGVPRHCKHKWRGSASIPAAGEPGANIIHAAGQALAYPSTLGPQDLVSPDRDFWGVRFALEYEPLPCAHLACFRSGSGQPGWRWMGPGDEIPVPQKALFPMERLPLKWQKVPWIGTWLHNLGKCFLHFTVQCLTYTLPLTSYLLSKEHSCTCDKGSFCMICITQNHVVQAFANSSSEDAHEFLRYTIEAMQKSSLSSCIKLDCKTQATALVHQIFGGYLGSCVECLVCKSVSDTPFLDLVLEIRAMAYPEVLNISPQMSCSHKRGSVMCELYAVLVHPVYSCQMGHYYCYVKASNGQRYQMNNSVVCRSAIKAVLSHEAYLLL